MNRPNHIYKYQPYNIQTLDNLMARQLWFSKVERFNDPFEQAYVFDNDVAEHDWNHAYKDLRDHQAATRGSSAGEEWDRKYMTDGVINEEFRQSILRGVEVAMAKQLLTEGGVCCFAENNDDVLMWAHYAHGHRGFCLEFDTSFEPFTTPDIKCCTSSMSVLQCVHGKYGYTQVGSRCS
ncbi:MAG: DUF2971 domain-containing protein, partial [Planctomycetes bacterium]|nr:DUF2971 domain-containing protein [Planctomycetota bacterium]